MSARMKSFLDVGFAALCLFLLSRSAVISQVVQTSPDVFQASKHALSPPIRDINPTLPVPGPPRVIQHAEHPLEITPAQRDPVLQTSPGQPFAAFGSSFDGVYDASQAAVSGVLFAPPDTNGAVGATQLVAGKPVHQYVQWVNYAFAVFDKTTGTISKGPIAGNALWANLGGQCASNNSGDQIAQYDKVANRWVMMQPVFTKPFKICIAVSTTADATGTYNEYEFTMPGFPDYPKLGIWPDGYYVSINLYNNGIGAGGKFQGAYVCALNRNALLAGNPAPTIICFQLSASYQSLLPADFDGSTQPPTNPPSPNFFLNLGTNALNFWKFYADFSQPSKSTITVPTSIPVANFAEACGGGGANGSAGGNCIPQLGTNRLLEALGDRLMYRLAYRNFGDHEALVVNHSVTAGSGVGVRWYELRTLPVNGVYPPMENATPQVFQSGTFASDGNFRWMGSVAMDKFGDMAVGYSLSSSNIHPNIGITGRIPTDTSGTLEAEKLLNPSLPLPGGSQLNISNWGDYSSMRVDPDDDCTFWYTTEYVQTDGKFNWRTRIASFKFPSCSAPATQLKP